MMNIIWMWHRIETLTGVQMYEILNLRAEIFVVEQTCFYLDPDEFDLQSWHLTGHHQGKLIAYARLNDPKTRYSQPSFGRVCCHQSMRGKGLGYQIVDRCINQSLEQYGAQAIKISAQTYLQKFYNSFGFLEKGDSYLEDGIEHVDMILPPVT